MMVAGATAVSLHTHLTPTPNIIKMILMYTAQPLAESNMLERCLHVRPDLRASVRVTLRSRLAPE